MHVTIHTSQTWADTFISELNDTHVEAELRTKHIPPQARPPVHTHALRRPAVHVPHSLHRARLPSAHGWSDMRNLGLLADYPGGKDARQHACCMRSIVAYLQGRLLQTASIPDWNCASI